MEKKKKKWGRREEVQQKIINAAGLGPLATGRSSDRCNVFTKQTSNTHVKRSENGDFKSCDLWKEAWYPSWHIFEGFEGISREMRRLHATPGLQERLAEFVLCYTPPSIPGSSGLLAGAVQGHRHWRAASKPLTFLITFHFGAVGNASRITIRQKNHFRCDLWFDFQTKLSLQKSLTWSINC